MVEQNVRTCARIRWLPVILLGGLTCVAAVGLLFSTFMMYDDEGYVLFSLKSFAEGGGLYERVYSQYGPFFFVFYQTLHLIGLEFTNNVSRLITLGCWLGAAGLCGAMVARTTRSPAATAFALGGVFLHLWPMVSEPSHPGGLIALIIAAVGWLGVRWRDRTDWLALAAGLAGTALLLTKINVGVFFLAGAGLWWLLHLDAPRISLRLRMWFCGAAAALLPALLMRGLFDQRWVVTFAIVSSAAAAATVLAAARGARPLTRWSQLPRAGLAALLLTFVVAAAVVAQGTSLRGLIEGVILGPLQHPRAYTAHINWRIGALPIALISLAWAAWSVARPSATTSKLVAGARLFAGGVYLACFTFNWELNMHAFALSYGLAAIWLFVLPLGCDEASQPVRAWLGLLLALQALHAFPVAGSQISWGTFLWIPLAAIAGHDAVRMLGLRSPWPRLATIALIAIVTVRCAGQAWVGIDRLRNGESPGFRGTELLRLPENFTTAMRVLTQNAAAHADVMFSLPGMMSFHLWTDIPPPTTWNTTHWFTLLSPAQQDTIRSRLEASPRSCVIVQRHIYQFLVESRVATESPLTQWLHANYEPAFSLDSYEFWVRKGRQIAPLGTATAREAAPDTTPRYQLALTLALPHGTQIHSAEIGRFYGDLSTPIGTFTAPDTQIAVTRLNSAGAIAAVPQRTNFPFEAGGLVRIELFTDRMPAGFLASRSVIYLLDATGRRVADARFLAGSETP